MQKLLDSRPQSCPVYGLPSGAHRGCKGPATSQENQQAHQVWLRGSQVSLPTLSMQNFCGPLLPVIQRSTSPVTGLSLPNAGPSGSAHSRLSPGGGGHSSCPSHGLASRKSLGPTLPEPSPPPPRGASRAREDAPMSSANPPTGKRQVPVTNCSSRILFSLSISFTTCNSESRSSQVTP